MLPQTLTKLHVQTLYRRISLRTYKSEMAIPLSTLLHRRLGMTIAHAIAPVPSLQSRLRLGKVVQACSICRAVAEVAAEGVEVAEVEVGWAGSRQDLEDPVCAHAAGIAHLM